MSDNIKVAIKVRPLIKREKDENLQVLWKVNGNTIGPTNTNENWNDSNTYTFDHIFDSLSTTADVFETVVKPIVNSAVSGINGTIFAYGQTSSGKTHTMIGTKNDSGIIPLAVSHLFDCIQKTPTRDFLLRVSYFEIYNEKVNDLLDTNNKDIKIHEDINGTVMIHCHEKVTTSIDSVLEQMHKGLKIRKMGSTNLNEHSSRSHTIFRLILESREAGQTDDHASVQVAHLNLVDLAGSERAAQSGASGIRLKEGSHINKSLLALSLVIGQLSECTTGGPARFINYRDSKLTRLLSMSLGGNTMTAILCAITPAALEETNSTLQFASNAKVIKNKPRVNEVISDASLMKKMARQLSLLNEELEQAKSNESSSNDMNQKLRDRIERLEQVIVFNTNKVTPESKLKAKKDRRMTWCAPGHRIPPARCNLASIYEEPSQTPESSITDSNAQRTRSSSNLDDFKDYVLITPLEEFERDLIPVDKGFHTLRLSEGSFSDIEGLSLPQIDDETRCVTPENDVFLENNSPRPKVPIETPTLVLRQRIRNIQHEYQELEEFTVQERDENFICLEMQLKNSKEECYELKTIVENLEVQLVKTNREKLNYLTEMNVLKKTVEAALNEKEDLIFKLEMTERTAKVREKELVQGIEEARKNQPITPVISNSQQEYITELERNVHCLEEQLKEQKLSNKAKTEMLSTNESDIQRLQKENISLLAELRQAEEKVAEQGVKLSETMMDHEIVLGDMLKKYQEAESKNHSLQLQIEILSKDVDVAVSVTENESLLLEINSLKSSLDQERSKISQLENDKEITVLEKYDISKKLESMKAISEQYNLVYQEKEKLSLELNVMQDTLALEKDIISDMKSKYTEIEHNMNSTNMDLNNCMIELEKAKTKHSEVQMQAFDLELKYSAALEEIQQLHLRFNSQQEISDLKSDKSELINKFALSESDRDELYSENAELHDKIKSLEQEHNMKNQDLGNDLNEFKQSITVLTSEIQFITSERDGLVKTLAETQLQLDMFTSNDTKSVQKDELCNLSNVNAKIQLPQLNETSPYKSNCNSETEKTDNEKSVNNGNICNCQSTDDLVRKLNRTNSILETDLLSANKKITEITVELNACLENLDELNLEKAEMETDLDTLSAKLLCKDTLVQSQEMEINELKKNMQQLEATIDELQVLKAELETTITVLKCELQTLHEAHLKTIESDNIVKNTLKEKEESIINLLKEIKDSRNQLDSKVAELEQCNSDYNELKSKYNTELTNIECQSSLKEIEINRLNLEKKDLENIYNSVLMQFDAYKEMTEGRSKQELVDTLTDQSRKLSEECEHLRNELACRTQELTADRMEIERLDNARIESKKLKLDIRSCKKFVLTQITQLDPSKSDLCSDLPLLDAFQFWLNVIAEKEKDVFKEIEFKYNKSCRWTLELETENNKLLDDLENSKSENVKLQQQLTDLQSSIRDCTCEIDALKQKLQDSGSDGLKDMLEPQSTKSIKNIVHDIENACLKNNLEELNNAKIQSDNKLQREQEQNVILTEKCKKLTILYDEIKSEHNDLATAVKLSKQQAIHREATINEANDKIQELSKKIELLCAENQEVIKVNTRLEQSNKDLKTKIEELRMQMSVRGDKIKELREQLDNMAAENSRITHQSALTSDKLKKVELSVGYEEAVKSCAIQSNEEFKIKCSDLKRQLSTCYEEINYLKEQHNKLTLENSAIMNLNILASEETKKTAVIISKKNKDILEIKELLRKMSTEKDKVVNDMQGQLEKEPRMLQALEQSYCAKISEGELKYNKAIDDYKCLQESLNRMELEIVELNHKNTVLNKDLLSLVKEKAVLKEKLRSSCVSNRSNESEELKETIQKLLLEAEGSKNVLAETKRTLFKEKDRLEQSLSDYRRELDQLKQENERLENVKVHMEHELLMSQERCKDLDEECDKCVSEMEDYRLQFTKVYGEKTLLEAKIKNLELELAESRRTSSPVHGSRSRRQSSHDLTRNISSPGTDSPVMTDATTMTDADNHAKEIKKMKSDLFVKESIIFKMKLEMECEVDKHQESIAKQSKTIEQMQKKLNEKNMELRRLSNENAENTMFGKCDCKKAHGSKGPLSTGHFQRPLKFATNFDRGSQTDIIEEPLPQAQEHDEVQINSYEKKIESLDKKLVKMTRLCKIRRIEIDSLKEKLAEKENKTP